MTFMSGRTRAPSGVLGDVGDQALGIGENVVAEGEHRAFRADLDALDIGVPT
jgi:hypothetical protein